MPAPVPEPAAPATGGRATEPAAPATGGYAAERAPDDKAGLRTRMRQLRRDRVPGRDRAADAEALTLAALEAAHAAGVGRGDWVAAYESMGTEPPTEALVAALVARGVRVLVPITLPDWNLDWREAGSDEPLGDDAIARAGLVLVPAHGVDTRGTRLGRGKGCYDRALPRTTAMVVAVVHPWEVLDQDLPHESHDRPVDAVIAAGSGLQRLPGGGWPSAGG